MSALINQARQRAPRIAEAAVDRARLTVVPRRRTRAPRVPFVMLVSLLLVGGVAGLLTFNTSMQQASFTATALEQRADALAAREQSLKMDLERLRDPQRVAGEAKEMGMVPPGNPAFLRLSDGKVLGKPAPAVAADAVRINDLPAQLPANLRPRKVVVPAPVETPAGTTAGTAADTPADTQPGAAGSVSDETATTRDGAAAGDQAPAAGTKKQQRHQTGDRGRAR